MKIKNPILKGFNPDPSIIKVKDDYYIVTSTFEWFPGYQIHHSKDLINWELVYRPLNRVSQLDMRGVPDSGGVWAPCISYNPTTKKYYLLYTNVLSFDGAVWKDTPNYLVTADDILGEWSDPIYLNSSGFDSSLFHDDDGKIYLVNMIVDHRKNKFFGGIVLQEYDPQLEKVVGEIYHIFPGTELGRTEAPHIYKRNGYYYLLTAEGGTEFGHAMTLARSKNLIGPYEVHPQNPIITAANNPDLYLQRTGHGDFVETPNGDIYGVFLCGRPLTKRGRCITGRETAIEKFEWRDDDWLYLASGGNEPREEVEGPELPIHEFEKAPSRNNFEGEEIDINFQSLRVPMTKDWVNQTDRSGYLRLYGRESLSSKFRQSLIARRVQAMHTITETCVEFDPSSYQQMAGLVCYYNTYHYYYLNVYGNDDGKRKMLGIYAVDKYEPSEPAEEPIDITGAKKVWLKVDYNGAELQFYYATEQDNWNKIGPVLDGSILSDEYVRDENVRYRAAFTGAFVGMCCQDLSGRKLHADFEYFEYQEIDD